MTEGERLAMDVEKAKSLLDAWILRERRKGRTLQAIADEVGMTRGGVHYIVRAASNQSKDA